MKTLRALTVFATTLLILVIGVLPVLATEAGDDGKSQLIMRSQHHIVGSMILLVFGVLVVAAVGNAVQQLRGKRDQADGRFRWR